MSKPIAINFFCGPGAGKSVQAAFLFGNLKVAGYRAELVPEYAKGLVWGEEFHKLEDQLYVFAKQNRHMSRVKNKVDVIVTDSPLLQNLAYADHMTREFHSIVLDYVNSYHNINILLVRGNNYDEAGRTQTKADALALDQKIVDLILNNGQVVHITAKVTEDNGVQGYIRDEVIGRLSAVGCLPI